MNAPMDPSRTDPVTGRPIDPATGRPVDPVTGRPVDPVAPQRDDRVAAAPVETRTRSVLPLIIGLLVLAALAWALMNYMNRSRGDATPVVGDTAATPAVTTPAREGMRDVPPGDPAATNDWFPIAAIFGGPSTYVDRRISGNARVVEVPSDRGFWIEQDGQRMFVMVNEPQSMEQALDINVGQTLALSGTVHDNTSIGRSGVSLTDEARQVIGGQKAFVLVQPADIRIVSQ